jgi:transketolase
LLKLRVADSAFLLYYVVLEVEGMNIKGLKASALSVRSLSMDAVQKAKSGHPGLPMGMAEFGSFLYGELLNHAPKHPDWMNRDRFVLSAGHGSMFLYSLLHLSGYDLSLEDIKQFRALGSRTPGHPEYGYTSGVETTTGPLGAGISNAVGMAIAEEMLSARFNTKEHPIIDHFTYALAGDGCLMEGVASEAASLAGHLKLGKLILFYDSNRITIEGGTELAFTENVAMRFEAYGWQVLEADAYDFEAMSKAAESAKAETSKPSLVILHSTIGKGAASMEGSHKVHGAPLGAEEIEKTRKNLGIPEEFYRAPEALEYFAGKQTEFENKYEQWNTLFDQWAAANPELRSEWDQMLDFSSIDEVLPVFKEGDKVATRKSSGAALQAIAEKVKGLVGGSADLGPSNGTDLKGIDSFGPSNKAGRMLHFGVREHAMAGIANGISLHGKLRPFVATFLVFADYLRPGLRLAAIMKQPVIYVLTHDSVYAGEDGPTHQPVEHLASLRVIPNVDVLRPGDAEESVIAWKMAAENTDGPTVLSLTRQDLVVYPKHEQDWKAKYHEGAYIAYEPKKPVDKIILATGSEVSLAIEAAREVEGTRVISVSSTSRLNDLAEDRWEELFPENAVLISAEAGSYSSWADIVDVMVSIDRFGESGPGNDVAQHLGFSKENLVEILKDLTE